MGVLFSLLAASVIGGVVWYFAADLPSIESLKEVQLQVPLRVYTQDKLLVAEFGDQRRLPLQANQIPDLMIKAVLAAEDDRFFEHAGVDVKSLIRAAVNLAKTGEIQQGASTITMQVAKNFFLTPERTFKRKFQEILLALKIEQNLSKDKILELYLNKIFFGHRAYGVAAAAQVYYGKDLKDLTVAEWAMLAAIPKAPSVNNPLTNPDAALERRNYVLKRMFELQYIDKTAYEQAIGSLISAKSVNTPIDVDMPYLAEMARDYMQRTYNDTAYNNGYRVYLTVDSHLQEVAQNSLRNTLIGYDERHGFRASSIKHVKLPPIPTANAINAATPSVDTIKTAQDILKDRPVQGDLYPSLVLEVKQTSILAYNLKVGQFEINWKNLAWARRYVHDGRVGNAPRTAHDLLKRGDIIMAHEILIPPPPEKKDKTDKTKAKVIESEGVVAEETEKPVQITSEWRLSEVPQVEGAFVALNPKDGAVIALAGGFDFYQSKFNRIIQAQRQPGSSFKPFIYSAALEYGFTPTTMINDAPVSFKVGNKIWRPANYSERFYGPTSFRTALAQSRNLVSIRILAAIGIGAATKHIVKFGFDKDKIPQNLTTALGTADLTPLELATGFAVFANGGYRIEPYFIQRIEDVNGNIVYQANPARVARECQKSKPKKEPKPTTAPDDKTPNALENPAKDANVVKETGTDEASGVRCAPQAISPYNAWVMNSLLQDVIRTGTAKPALALKRKDIAGKTGTTNDQHDAWFSGYNPDVVATAWVGFDQPRSLGESETGGRTALPMWINFMREALKGKPEREAPRPPKGVVTVKVNTKGLLSGGKSPDGQFEIFSPGNVPTRHVKSTTNKSQTKPTATDSADTETISSGEGSRSASNRTKKGGDSAKPSSPPLIPDQLF
jgi:penicillin-binding protein 1A